MKGENNLKQQLAEELSFGQEGVNANKRTNLPLENERNFCSIILDSTRDLILVCDQEGRIVTFNKACEEVSGYVFDSIKGSFVWDLLLPLEDVGDAKVLFGQYISIVGSIEHPQRFENHWIAQNGERRLISWTTTPFVNENDQGLYLINIGTDITDQRALEEKMHEFKLERHSVFENANGVFYALSPEGKFLFVTRRWTEMLGHEVDEVKGRSFEDFVHPEYVSVCKKYFGRAVTDNRNQKGVEYLTKHRDGTWRWHSSSGSPVKDDEGKLKYYIGMAVDITAQKQSEEKFAKAFLCSPDTCSITTLKEGLYVEINEAAIDLFGYERYEIVGHTTPELGIWAVPEERDLMVKQVQEQGRVRDREVKFRLKNGDIGTFLFSAEIIDIGGVQHLLGVSKDITQRKRMEEELRLSEERFSKAFRASLSSMTITTLEEGLIVAVNESFCRSIGYDYDEVVRLHSSVDIGFWPNIETRDSIKKKLIKEGSILDMEIIFRNKAREERVGLYSAEIIEIDGVACILSVITDITERKQAEEEILYLSLHDKLTGLYNRAYFEIELNRIDTQRTLPFTLIIGDVNGLKLINDALGHQAGDKLLIKVAEKIRYLCRPEDIIARWGGDEFIVLMPGCDTAAAAGVFEQIRDACKNIDGMPIQAGVSFGMASKCDAAEVLGEVIKEAEDKMYRRKLMDNRSTRSSFLTSLEQTLWTRSHETKEHCQRLQNMVQKIGQLLNLPESELDSLRLLAALHDIGKIAIPNSVLDKPGKLTPEEWELVKKHPETGYRIALSSPEMAPIAEAILHHHERWDGTGYPLGIKGEDIPLISRIVAIADTYDVMINGRPYQKAVSQETVYEEIRRCAGSQFDPEIVNRILEAGGYPIF